LAHWALWVVLVAQFVWIGIERAAVAWRLWRDHRIAN
jgi:hypothetical protein